MTQRCAVPRLSRLLAGLVFFWAVTVPEIAVAQDAPLRVVIDRPGAGETYYTGPYGPRTLAPIEGRVAGGTFDPTQVEIQLELLQDGKNLGRESTVPNAQGAFIFRIMINATGSAELSTPESNCFSCHEIASLVAPAGAFSVRVTAIDPSGIRAVAERAVTLDLAGSATFTVRVEVAEDAGRAVQGLAVEARTLVYGWRGRAFTARTDEQGLATLAVEALALRPTRYQVSVPAALIDGVLYQTVSPVALELPAGVRSAGPFALAVTARLGQLSGTLSLPGAARQDSAALTVRAVELPYGRSFSGPALNDRYNLSGLPLGSYLAGLDRDQAAAAGWQAREQKVDLGAQPNATCDLAPAAAAGGTVRGSLTGKDGDALPFGWISGGAELLAQAGPATGAFALFDVPVGQRTLRVSAPGYWSRTIPATPNRALAVNLEPRPGTHEIAWGAGSLVVPEGTLVTGEGDRLRLQRGWLWGRGDRPLTITTPEAEIEIVQGAFALEYLAGESAWFYLLAGQAEISRGSEASLLLAGGQMCSFAGPKIARLVPAALDANAIAVLSAGRPLPVTFETKPGIESAIREALANAGVLDLDLPATAVTLLAVTALLCGLAMVAHRRPSRSPEHGAGRAGGANL